MLHHSDDLAIIMVILKSPVKPDPSSTARLPQSLQTHEECLRLLHGPLLPPSSEQRHLVALAHKLLDLRLIQPAEDARVR